MRAPVAASGLSAQTMPFPPPPEVQAALAEIRQPAPSERPEPRTASKTDPFPAMLPTPGVPDEGAVAARPPGTAEGGEETARRARAGRTATETRARPACRLDGSCRLRSALDAALDAFLAVLAAYTLEDLAQHPTPEALIPLGRGKLVSGR